MKTIEMPMAVDDALTSGADLAVNISGGKDSQALLSAIMHIAQKRRWTGEIFALHADTGRTEWPQTLSHCRHLAQEAGIPLVIVRRTKGDLLARWQDRMEQLGDSAPFWSSAANRYCTSDLKRDPADKHFRKSAFIVSAEGIRADESPARARKPALEVRSRITAKRLKHLAPLEAFNQWDRTGRLAFTWRPIIHWTEEDVWNQCGTSSKDLARRRALYRAGAVGEALAGWPCHPAYVYGNERLSCAICVLASANDIRNGAQHNPELAQRLLEMEQDSGWTFRARQSLKEILA